MRGGADIDGYALRELFVAWLDEGEGAARAREALTNHGRGGKIWEAMLANQTATKRVAKGERQSVFAEDVDSAYCSALGVAEETLRRKAPAGAAGRGGPLFHSVEETATRAAMCLLSEMTKTPFERGAVAYFLYPESFLFGADYWPLRVRRYEMTKDKGQYGEQQYLAAPALCVGRDEKPFAEGWALLLVRTEHGEHYDLIRLQSASSDRRRVNV